MLAGWVKGSEKRYKIAKFSSTTARSQYKLPKAYIINQEKIVSHCLGTCTKIPEETD